MDIRDWIDQLLEITVIGSFTRVGPAVRGRLYGWRAPSPDALRGRTVLITGPTSGLGRATAEELADLGARVVLVGRNEVKLAGVRQELTDAHGEDRFPIVVADMGSLESVRAAVERVLATEDRLDILIDNAGAISPERTIGPDGIETTFAILTVTPFALVSGLLPLLRRTPGSRVIAVTSGGQYTQSLDLDDVQGASVEYSGAKAYARAKRAQVALIREWARRIPDTEVTFNAMHPGWADTPGVEASLPGFYNVMRPLLRTPAEGADTILFLATAARADLASGQLYLDRRPRPFDRVRSTRLSAADRRRLWDIIVGLSGVTDPAPDPAPDA